MKYKSTQDILIYIRQQMLSDKISLKDLALKMNKAQSTLSMQFKQENITLEALNDICKALGYNLNINITKDDTE